MREVECPPQPQGKRKERLQSVGSYGGAADTPLGGTTPSLWFDDTLVPKLTQHEPDHVPADTRTVSLDVRDGEWCDPFLGGPTDLHGLAPFAGRQSTHAFFKFTIGAKERPPEVVEPWGRIVAPFVPTL